MREEMSAHGQYSYIEYSDVQPFYKNMTALVAPAPPQLQVAIGQRHMDVVTMVGQCCRVLCLSYHKFLCYSIFFVKSQAARSNSSNSKNYFVSDLKMVKID